MPGAPKRLRCEYLENPIGIGVRRPRLSWWLDDERPAEIQTGYRIIASARAELLEDERGDLWDTGRVESATTVNIPWGGAPLGSRQRVYWRVRAFDSDGIGSPWSRTSFFEAGLLDEDDWRARWIATPLMGSKQTPAQVPALRRSFELTQVVVQARLYVTAFGVYDLEINGRRVTEAELAPGWTDYRKRVRYQAYDVTRFLDRGENVLGLLLGDGWYCGFLGLSERQQYGDRPALLAQLELLLADGSRERIVTDDLWKWQRSPILYADLMDGESVDARQALPGWSEPGYDAVGWTPVQVLPRPLGVALDATMSPLIRIVDRLEPVGGASVRSSAFGENRFVYDFGQNLVGRVRLQIRARRGTQVRIRHAERLDAHGDLYTANLRNARATDFYTCAGAADGETFEPRFTYHGFQYVEVAGQFDEAAVQSISAVVLSSALSEIGEFQCDHPLVNQLQSNIVWSQRGNFIDVPTDCPQRDERLGWTGDAQVFVRTSAFNFETAPFFAKWMVDVADAQFHGGTVPPVAPLPPALKALRVDGGPGWSDAIVICPWTMYRCFGDRDVLERHFEAMTAFIADQQKRYPTLIRADASMDRWQGFGDWLAADAPTTGDARSGTTPKDLIGTAFFCYSAKLLARIAGVLGNLSDLERYEELAQRIRAAFRRRFVTADGRLVGETQTAYVLALHFGLLEPGETDNAVTALVRDIESRGNHLSTGFLGTPYLLPVLTAHGRVDLAYRLLLQTSPPGWLYPITEGATTIWERWDGYTEARGFQDAAMNSFNHYAYGAVGEWLYGTLAGLELDPDLSATRNAYRQVRIQPRPALGDEFPNGALIRFASAALDTVHGRYEVSWEISGGEFRIRVRIPPNCRARVVLPNAETRDVPAGRHEFTVALGELADDGIPVLSEITELAS
jgi:alpha-L-rhamnosidase